VIYKLIKILSDGQFHSGEDVGKQLGVTRAAVWKAVQKLPALGLQYDSVTGKGYRIPAGVDLLDKEAIEAHLSDEAKPLFSGLEVFDVLGSTNDLVADRVKSSDTSGGHTGFFCLAEQQTAGRGRRGKEWVSPYAKNIYLSFAWQFERGIAAIEGLSLAVGLGVANALDQCQVPGVELKWPNDLLVSGNKLGGILIEMTGDLEGACQVVIGVGVNVSMTEAQGQSIDQAWQSISSLNAVAASDRNKLVGSVMSELLLTLSRFESEGFAAYRDQWQEKDYFLNKPVTLMIAENPIQGIARGIAENGALRLEVDGQIKEFSGGEISLRARA